MSPSYEQRYVEYELRERAREAEVAYRTSANASKRVIEDSNSWDWNNGASGFHSALAVERAALEKYRRALEIFNDFLLYRKPPSPQHLLGPVLTRAVGAGRADMGNIQTFDRRERALKITAQRGCKRPFLDFFSRVHQGHGAACGAAWKAAARVVVSDVKKSPIFAGTDSLQVLLDARVHAVQSTPLISPSGEIVGVLSTHYRNPARLTDDALQALLPVAREAGLLIAGARLQ